MTHVPHDLAEEFPEFKEKMHELQMSNPHFSRCFDEYHQLNRQVHRNETDIEPLSDAVMNDLRKRRMTLKDEIYSILRNNQSKRAPDWGNQARLFEVLASSLLKFFARELTLI